MGLNLHRRHLDPSQKALVGLNAKEYLAKEALKRMGEGGKRSAPGKPAEKGVENLPPLINQGKARDQAAALIGISGKLVDFLTLNDG